MVERARVVEDRGSGEVVLLLHGWPVTALHWRFLIPALLAAGRRVIVVGLPGLGVLEAAIGPYDKQTLARDVRGLVDRVGLDRFAVVGHDWGGTVGYLLARDVGSRVRMLVVEEEIPPGSEATIPEPGRSHYPTWHGPFLRSRGLAEALVPGREDVLYRTFLIESAGPTPLDSTALNAYVTAYSTLQALTATLGYYRTAREDAAAMREHASEPLVAPVLTIGGEFGMGTAVADAWSAVGTQVQHLQVPRAGHYPLEQSPDVVLPALISHLR